MPAGETVKNRETHAVGTRVKNAFHKIDWTPGTVVEHDSRGRAVVRWDGQRTPAGSYEVFELKAVGS